MLHCRLILVKCHIVDSYSHNVIISFFIFWCFLVFQISYCATFFYVLVLNFVFHPYFRVNLNLNFNFYILLEFFIFFFSCFSAASFHDFLKENMKSFFLIRHYLILTWIDCIFSVSSQCCEGGVISPSTCIYITKWLAVPDDHSTNEKWEKTNSYFLSKSHEN